MDETDLFLEVDDFVQSMKDKLPDTVVNSLVAAGMCKLLILIALYIYSIVPLEAKQAIMELLQLPTNIFLHVDGLHAYNQQWHGI